MTCWLTFAGTSTVDKYLSLIYLFSSNRRHVNPVIAWVQSRACWCAIGKCSRFYAIALYVKDEIDLRVKPHGFAVLKWNAVREVFHMIWNELPLEGYKCLVRFTWLLISGLYMKQVNWNAYRKSVLKSHQIYSQSNHVGYSSDLTVLM